MASNIVQPFALFSSDHVNFLSGNIENFSGDKRAEAAIGILTLGISSEVRAEATFMKEVAPLAKEPLVSAGATLEKLTVEEIKRIQNAANRTGTEISVVGSRVNPAKALNAESDYDYVVTANAKTRNSLQSSLPGAKSVQEGTKSNLDIFTVLKEYLPYVTFNPH